MECTLATLIACFSWSNLYLDGGVLYNDIRYVEVNPVTLETAAVEKNPFGRAAIGYELKFRSVEFALEASHTSSLATNSDRGANAIGIRARWYPFR